MTSEHSNWLCPTKWEARLGRLLAKLHDSFCNCQMEPWNHLSKAQIKERRRAERAYRRQQRAKGGHQ